MGKGGHSFQRQRASIATCLESTTARRAAESGGSHSERIDIVISLLV